MTNITATVDKASRDALNDLLARIATLTPERLASEVRHAAILLCTSLRSKTRQAPKKIPRKEYAATPSVVPPRYMFYYGKNDKTRKGKRDKPLRRWTLARKLGTPDAYANHYFVYMDAHRGPRGKMVGKNANAEKKELLKFHGGIHRHGLAKKSWGWIAKQIYNAAIVSDLAYKPRKGERRDPRNEIKGIFRKFIDGGQVEIENKLDYIMAALRPGALDDSMRAATKRLENSVAAALLEAENSNARPSSGTNWWKAYERAKGRN